MLFLSGITELALVVEMTPTGNSGFNSSYLLGYSHIWIQKRCCSNHPLLVANETRSLVPPAEQETSKSPNGKVMKGCTSWKLPSNAMRATENTGVFFKSWSIAFHYFEKGVRRVTMGVRASDAP